MYKTHHVRASFGKLRCRKSARCCGAKHISKSTCTKNLSVGPLLEVALSKKCTPLWREAHFEVNMWKAPGSDHFWTFRCRFAWQVQRDCASCQKWARRNEGFVSISKKRSQAWGHLKRIWKDAFSVAGAVQEDIFIRAVRRSGRWFLETDCILEHQIRRFAKMILRDRCSTSYDLASLFRGGRGSYRWTGKIANRIGTRTSALHSTFHFWRKSRRIVSFLTFQLRKLRRSRRIISSLMLSSSKIEEVSQNSIVFKLADS